MTAIDYWLHRWKLPRAALDELEALTYGDIATDQTVQTGVSEEAIAQRIVLNSAHIGQTLWRNNSGALVAEDGRMVRFGLANTSKKINEKFKSSDYIGITKVEVQPHHVGMTFGVFTAVETKVAGWVKPKNSHEQAQLNFLNKVHSMGGIGLFATSVEQVATTVSKVRGNQW